MHYLIKIDSNTIENNLTFVGLIGMIDPPREGVKEAVKNMQKSWNKNSNDNRRSFGNCKGNSKRFKIFPEHKVRIVKAWQKKCSCCGNDR